MQSKRPRFAFPQAPRALAAGALLVIAAPIAEVAYSPEAGATDSQYWTVSHSLELMEVEASMSDDSEVNVPEVVMQASRSRSLTLDQVHEGAEDGSPVRLRRSFVEVEEALSGTLQIEADGLNEELDASVEPLLEDQSVRFEWDAKGGEWKKRFVDEEGEDAEGDEDLLEGLAADAHLGGLLVGLDNAEAGAVFQAEPEALIALILPGGDLGAPVECSPSGDRGMEPIVGGLDPLLGMDLHYLLAGEAEGKLDGDITGRIAELGDDGRAKIELKVSVTGTRDVLERVTPWIEGLQDGIEAEVIGAAAEIEINGDGVLEWDLESGLPVALELELSLEYSLEREAEVLFPGQEAVVLSTKFRLEGELTSSMSGE